MSKIVIIPKGNAKVREEYKNIEAEDIEEEIDDEDYEDVDDEDFKLDNEMDEDDDDNSGEEEEEDYEGDQEGLVDVEEIEEEEESEEEEEVEEEEEDEENDDFEIPNIDDEINNGLNSETIKHQNKLFDEWLTKTYYKNDVLKQNAQVVPNDKFEEIMRCLRSDDTKDKGKK